MTAIENQIQLIDLDQELKRLWDKEQGQKKIRASLFNLVLYVQKNERASDYQNLIKSTVSKFPSRVILILADDKEEHLKAEVSSQTVGAEKQIYCEIIQVEAGGKLLERVPFLILPHILPDLPLYLLWTQDPATENAILPFLERFANRIIFDSNTMKDISSYIKAVMSLSQRFHCEIGDLNWSAISGWRKLFSQVFDDPEAFKSLEQSKAIHIGYNRAILNGSHSEIEAIYFQAWLASRLNWKFLSYETHENQLRFHYKHPSSEIAIFISPQEISHLKPGTLISVEIESVRNKAHFSFKRHPETRQVFLQYFDKERCDLPLVSNLAGALEGQEIIDEIFYPTDKKHYQEVLTFLNQIAWRKQ